MTTLEVLTAEIDRRIKQDGSLFHKQELYNEIIDSTAKIITKYVPVDITGHAEWLPTVASHRSVTHKLCDIAHSAVEDSLRKLIVASSLGIMPASEVAPERVAELRTMPYAQYLATDEWRARSARAKQAAGHRCQLCNSEGELHTHHRTYASRGDELPGDLIVLCKACHARHHGKEQMSDDVRVIKFLCSKGLMDEVVEKTQQEIATGCGITLVKANGALADLEVSGWITVERAYRQTNKYRKGPKVNEMKAEQ
jgi:hypothetical protein